MKEPIRRCTILKTLAVIKFLWLSSLVIPSSGLAEASYSVEIKAPIQQVWEYVQNDANASDWSIFFKTIEKAPMIEYPQNAQLTYKDLGFVRRCYRNVSKKGLFWDEKTVEIKKQPHQFYKKIQSFNFHGYGNLFKEMFMHVEQVYTAINEDSTRLTFSTHPFSYEQVENSSNDPSWWKYQLNIFSYSILSKNRALEIFKKNLENIKYFIENPNSLPKSAPYQYEKFCDPDSQFWCLNSLVEY